METKRQSNSRNFPRESEEGDAKEAYRRGWRRRMEKIEEHLYAIFAEPVCGRTSKHHIQRLSLVEWPDNRSCTKKIRAWREWFKNRTEGNEDKSKRFSGLANKIKSLAKKT